MGNYFPSVPCPKPLSAKASTLDTSDPDLSVFRRAAVSSSSRSQSHFRRARSLQLLGPAESYSDRADETTELSHRRAIKLTPKVETTAPATSLPVKSRLLTNIDINDPWR